MNTDVQNYIGALSQVNFSNELINEKVQTQMQQREVLMPFSELALGESGKLLLEKGVEFAKEAGVNAVKNFARGKMTEAGVDPETIDTVLSGDLTNLSKVSSLINVAKQKALDVAKTKMQEAGVDDDTINSILKGDFSGAIKGKVDQAISKVKSKVTDSIDNVSDDLKQSISTSQGIADDLKAQAMQEYNKMRIDNGEMPTLMENDSFMSGIGNRFMNMITQQPPPEPQDIELVDMASLPPKPPIVTTATTTTDATVDTGTDIAGSIAEVGADIGLGELLGPIGIIGGLIGGIVGIVEGEKKPSVPQGILNPSEQFL